MCLDTNKMFLGLGVLEVSEGVDICTDPHVYICYVCTCRISCCGIVHSVIVKKTLFFLQALPHVIIS